MTIFPLSLSELLGHWGAYVVYLIIGFLFGFVLEIAGFGNSKKLAAQFYFTEMTVLKVMFSAIIVAMVLIFLATAVGLLDYNLLWVNPTYLIPGIVGGLIMGVGFIVGGFCPGTSLVSAATLKLDGIMFVLGVFFGIFLFGETVGLYEDFWFSTYMGRFTLMDLFNTSTGMVVLVVVLAALLAFVGAELSEKYIGKMNLAQFGKWRFSAAGGLIALAVVVLFIGQPTNADRWSVISEKSETQLNDRDVQIHPAELLDKIHDRTLSVVMLDVRSITDFNQFHILDAEHLEMSDVITRASDLRMMPGNTLIVVMSNDETAATEAWKLLLAESVSNVYILEGGINNWLSIYADTSFVAENRLSNQVDDALLFSFPSALGSRYAASNPNPEAFEIEYEPRVQLVIKRGPASGGCG